MRFVQHAAASTLARNAQEAHTIGARRIDFMVNDRTRRVTDSESGAREPHGHFGLFLVARGAGPQAFIKQPHPCERRGAKRHVRAEHAAHLDYLLAVIDERQIEPWDRTESNLKRRILGRQYAPLHGRELWIVGKKTFDFVEVIGSRDQIVVKAYD